MPSTQKSTPKKSAASRKTTQSGGSSPQKKSRTKSAASSVKSAAGAIGGKVTEGAKSAKNLSKGKLIAGAAGLAAATAAGAVIYKKKSNSGRTVYHVKPDGEGWAVKGDGAERASSTHDTKKEALTAARELAHSKVPSQLVVHKADGSVQEKWSYDAQ